MRLRRRAAKRLMCAWMAAAAALAVVVAVLGGGASRAGELNKQLFIDYNIATNYWFADDVQENNGPEVTWQAYSASTELGDEGTGWHCVVARGDCRRCDVSARTGKTLLSRAGHELPITHRYAVDRRPVTLKMFAWQADCSSNWCTWHDDCRRDTRSKTDTLQLPATNDSMTHTVRAGRYQMRVAVTVGYRGPRAGTIHVGSGDTLTVDSASLANGGVALGVNAVSVAPGGTLVFRAQYDGSVVRGSPLHAQSFAGDGVQGTIIVYVSGFTDTANALDFELRLFDGPADVNMVKPRAIVVIVDVPRTPIRGHGALKTDGARHTLAGRLAVPPPTPQPTAGASVCLSDVHSCTELTAGTCCSGVCDVGFCAPPDCSAVGDCAPFGTCVTPNVCTCTTNYLFVPDVGCIQQVLPETPAPTPAPVVATPSLLSPSALTPSGGEVERECEPPCGAGFCLAVEPRSCVCSEDAALDANDVCVPIADGGGTPPPPGQLDSGTVGGAVGGGVAALCIVLAALAVVVIVCVVLPRRRRAARRQRDGRSSDAALTTQFAGMDAGAAAAASDSMRRGTGDGNSMPALYSTDLTGGAGGGTTAFAQQQQQQQQQYAQQQQWQQQQHASQWTLQPAMSQQHLLQADQHSSAAPSRYGTATADVFQQHATQAELRRVDGGGGGGGGGTPAAAAARAQSEYGSVSPDAAAAATAAAAAGGTQEIVYDSGLAPAPLPGAGASGNYGVGPHGDGGGAVPADKSMYGAAPKLGAGASAGNGAGVERQVSYGVLAPNADVPP